MASKKKNEPASENKETKEAAKAKEDTAENTVSEPADETEAQEAEVKDAQQNTDDALKEANDKYMRLAAEYDNFRKRSAREREQIYSDVRIDTVSKLMPVYDNLERALNAPTEDAAYKKGVEMTFNQLLDVFKKLGIEEIEAVGKQFDPNLHNAVMHMEDEQYGENEIVEQFQKGFRLGEKVIRHSMVKVAN